MDWLTQPLSIVLVALVTAIGSWVGVMASKRSADKAVAGQIEMSRIQAETNAFQRAKDFYEQVITRQDSELASLRQQLATVQARLSEQDVALEDCKSKCRVLARRLGSPDFLE